MKKLCEFIDTDKDIEVKGITDDSRLVKDGYIFVATEGYFVDHFTYVNDAVKNGACLVVANKEVEVDVPCLVVDDVNSYYIQLCKKFYDISLEDFKFVGVTGTDGKTTVTTVIQRLFNNYNKWALIGTNGVYADDDFYETHNTTPCISELFQALRFIKDKKCQNIVMEVSSEALLHKRLESFLFDAIIFTNITEDHLNIHKTIDNYRKCKFKLLDMVKDKGIVIINGDDENCKMIYKDNMYSVGMNTNNDFVISNVKEMSNSVKFSVVEKDKIYNINSPLIGLYNVYNVSMAFVLGILMGYDSKELIDKISVLPPIKGRGEYLDFGQPYKIVLDYAHTYNGIANILESVAGYEEIIVVTGAAGGREKEKRAKIGKLILEKATLAIFTMDDPRYEDVNEIINQMVGNSKTPYLRIIDRRKAIIKAFNLASSKSIVLILGKGRDNYMAIEDRKEYYSDYDVIEEYFKK